MHQGSRGRGACLHLPRPIRAGAFLPLLRGIKGHEPDLPAPQLNLKGIARLEPQQGGVGLAHQQLPLNSTWVT
jgi:hypothetical protein